MRNIVNFLFVIDVSGSMYGQKIAAVNASLSECMAELKQIVLSGNYDIRVSVVTFAEKMKLHKINENPENIGAPYIKVEPQADGFYLVASFSCLYKGLKNLFNNKKIVDGNQGKNTFVILFSDAKPVDSKEYMNAYEEIHQCLSYRNATKYVAYVEEKFDKYSKDTVKFVDFKAEHIVRVAEMSGEISKLQMTFFSDISNQSDNAKYDQIFV